MLSEADVEDVVCIALLPELELTRVSVEAVDVVVVAFVDHGHEVSAVRHGDRRHSSSARVQLKPLLLPPRYRIPSKAHWRLSHLPTGCGASVGRDTDGRNVVVVALLGVRGVL